MVVITCAISVQAGVASVVKSSPTSTQSRHLNPKQRQHNQRRPYLSVPNQIRQQQIAALIVLFSRGRRPEVAEAWQICAGGCKFSVQRSLYCREDGFKGGEEAAME
ncbi:hypothetical protein L2E82_15989 [Cichorium intybus]|uniref:Uncharacterized protein n=1 Tax=Cichorium intybus TaxID=13427 RepID=A0ACB9F5J8_CICIN|nr:hypothetical protein L2E82_15989 [Cichorium intybus]